MIGEWVQDDGGRAAAGYKGYTGDCGVRAIAIATGMPYQEVYDLVLKYADRERGRKSKRTGKIRKSHPRTGIFISTMKKIMADLGWEWVATMAIGTGCQVHLDANELPPGRVVVRVSHHYTTMIDGVIHDTYNPNDRDFAETARCVYGYWRKPE